jgi:phage tail sheath gpL-like
MKQNLLLGALLAVISISFAHATGNENGGEHRPNAGGGSSATAIAGAQALSISGALALGGGASVQTGATSVNVSENQNDHIIPVASAIAPNIHTSVDCPIISQSSHAVQLLVFGGSTSGTTSVNPICVAYHLGQTAVVEKMACKYKEYADANPNCEVQ